MYNVDKSIAKIPRPRVTRAEQLTTGDPSRDNPSTLHGQVPSAISNLEFQAEYEHERRGLHS